MDKKNVTSVFNASLQTGLSEVQIYMLYRNHLIKGRNSRIYYDSLKRWMKYHHCLSEELKKSVDERDLPNAFSSYLVKTHRRKPIS